VGLKKSKGLDDWVNKDIILKINFRIEGSEDAKRKV
jgi:hypothetical protein